MKRPSSSNNRSSRGKSTSRRPQGQSGSNSSNRSTSSNRSNSSNSRRGSSSRNQAAQEWMSASGLTSHIAMKSKPKKSNQPRKNDSKNDQGTFNRNKRKNKPYKDREQQGRPMAPQSAKAGPASDNNGSTTPLPKGDKTLVSNIDPFELFCAYHLGITADKNYKSANINEVANRFRVEPAVIKTALKSYGMDSEALMNRDFDMALGQLDIQVSPEGVDRVELAKGIYEDFQNAPEIKRDWKKILEEDRKENMKVFGDR